MNKCRLFPESLEFRGDDVTPAQSRAARSFLNWSLAKAAREADIGVSTLQRFERGDSVLHVKVLALERAYEAAGIEFAGKTGVHLKGSPSS